MTTALFTEPTVAPEPTVAERAPRRTRSQVLFDTFDSVAKTALDKPGEWFLVGGGPQARYGVFSQTAYRIRRGQIKAFQDPQGGAWEVQVSTDQRVEREYPVEVYLRFKPVQKA